MSTSRFECPSFSLTLGALLRRGKVVVGSCAAAAVAAHVSLTVIRGLEPEQKAAKPLTTQFVKRQPRLTKPLELKKLPRPKQRTVRRKMVAVRARATGRRVVRGVRPVDMVRTLARPDVRFGRLAGLKSARLEPQALAGRIAGSREDKHVVDMSLEMVDIEALDTGEFHAMVIQDPTDRRKIKGFFHLLLARPMSLSDFGGRGSGESVWDDFKIAFRRLVEAMNTWTQIRVSVAGQITFDDAELFKVPWVMTPIPNREMNVTPSEAANMGQYLSAGGFQFLENAWGCNLGVYVACRRIIQDIMASVRLVEGRDWSYERLPKDHAVYHCYYDFDVPPYGEDFANYHARKGGGYDYVPPRDYLEGISIDGRMWILFGQKGYAIAWHDWRPGGGAVSDDATRVLQFGINTVIFALTQEGSITNRVMDSVRY